MSALVFPTPTIIIIRRRRNQHKGQPRREGSVWLHNNSNSNNSNSDVCYYPEYYLNDFHYQTDGPISSESAQNYEASTDTLFLIPMLK